MDPVVIGTVGLSVSVLLILLRVPIAFSLGAAAISCIYLFFAFPSSGGVNLDGAARPALTLVTTTYFGLFHSYDLTAVPLFIALGHVCYRAGITSDIYFAARSWLTRVPGGLAAASILGCGGFSAISGSSVACAATMGRIAVPEMRKYGYSDGLASGSVAAGGTLGALIPPSLLFILYGIFAEQSISKLFLAGVIPGLVSMVGYVVVVAIWATWRPADAPSASETITHRERIVAAIKTWPAFLIFTIIVGGIYGGWFTATEAASVTLAIAVVISLAGRRITLRDLVEAMRETVLQSAAIFLIAGAAKVFVTFVSLTGVANALVAFVQHAQLGPIWLILAIVGVYLLLGMFLDPIGIMLLTLPFTLPLIESQGFNLIWFGVIVIKLLEMGLITPPVGLNVFVLNSVVRPKVPVERMFLGVAPFFAMDLLVLALLLIFPVLSIWLPSGI